MPRKSIVKNDVSRICYVCKLEKPVASFVTSRKKRMVEIIYAVVVRTIIFGSIEGQKTPSEKLVCVGQF